MPDVKEEIGKELELLENTGKILGRVFGSKADNFPDFMQDIPELKNTEINPGNLTEEQVQAVCFAVFCDPKFTNYIRPEFTQIGVPTPDYILMNVLTGEKESRAENNRYAIYEARKKAAEIIAAFNSGNADPMNKAMSNLADYLNTNGSTLKARISPEGKISASFYEMIDKVKDTDVCQALGNGLSPDAQVKMTEQIELQKILENDKRKTLELLEKDNKMQIDEAALDILTDYTIAMMAHEGYGAMYVSLPAVQEAQQEVNVALVHDEIENHYTETQKKIISENIIATNLPQQLLEGARVAAEGIPSVISDLLFIQTDKKPENVALYNQFRTSLKRKLLDSDIYKKIVKEHDVSKIADTLNRYWSGGSPAKFNRNELDPDFVETESQYREKYQQKMQEAKPKFLEHVKKVTANGILKGAIRSEQNRKLREANGNKQTGEIYKEGLEKFLQDNQIHINLEKCYKQDGGLLRDAINNISTQDTIYCVASDNKSIYKIDIDVTEEKQLVFHQTKLNQMPLYTGHFAGDHRIYQINADLLKAQAAAANGALKADNAMRMVADALNAESASITAPVKPTAVKDAVNNLCDTLAALRKTETVQMNDKQFTQPHLTTEAEVKTLMRSYETVKTTIAEYQKANPFDKRMNDLSAMAESDLTLLRSLNLEEMNMPLSIAMENVATNQLKKEQNQGEVFGTKSDITMADDLRQDALAVIEGYYFKNAPVMKWSDGTRRVVDGCPYSLDGMKLTEYEKADFLKDNENEILDEMKAKVPQFDEKYADVDYNIEGIKQRVKRDFPNAKFPEDEEITRRLEFSQSNRKALREVTFTQTLEYSMAMKTGTAEPERWLQNCVKLSGSDADRKWNRKFMELAGSKEPKDLKEAYEMAIEEISQLKPEDYDIRDDSLFTQKPIKAYRFASMCADITHLAESAMKLGIDLRAPKYDTFRKNAPILEYMAGTFNEKLACICNPLYSAMEPSQFTDLAAITTARGNIDDPLPGILNSAYKDISALNMQYADANNAFTDKKLSVAECIQQARKNCGQLTSIEPGDTNLVKAKNAMEADVKTYLGFKKSSTALYTNVLRAIDAYREAPYYEREAKRRQLVKECNTYLHERKTGKKRTELVRAVKEAADGLKDASIGYNKEARLRVAKQMMDEGGVLNALMVISSNYNPQLFKEKADKYSEILKNPEKHEKWLNKLSKSKQCEMVMKNPQLIQNKRDLFDKSMQAVREVLDGEQARGAFGFLNQQRVQQNQVNPQNQQLNQVNQQNQVNQPPQNQPNQPPQNQENNVLQ